MENKEEAKAQDTKETAVKETDVKETSATNPEPATETSGEANPSKAKQWFQDNLRIIVSVVIVILIAGGIYSYSKRSETPQTESAVQTNEQSESQNQSAGQNTPDNASNQNASQNQTSQQAQSPAQQQGQAQPQSQSKSKTQAAPQQTSSVSTSQETANAFVETAVRGDSETTLARRAVADYLEKNPDSALTPEHKIYIEDYLVKNIPRQRIYVGTSVEFSKNLIRQAITASKNLNSQQLQNLHKYAVLVPSLS